MKQIASVAGHPWLLLCRCAAAALVLAAAACRPMAWQAAVETIRPEAIRAHMRFLADDALEGRLSGTGGYDLAAKYVAAQAIGLEPAGTDGFLQSVPLLRMQPATARVAIIHAGRRRELSPGRDFVAAPIPAAAHANIRAPATFVGYGVRCAGVRL